MVTCSICVHDCVYVCSQGGEQGATALWIRKMAFRLFECLSSPKGSCVQALPLLTPVIILLLRSCQLLNYMESYETARAAEHCSAVGS